MEKKAFIYDIWSPLQLLMRDEIGIILSRDLELIYGVHNIYSQEMESKAFTLERWILKTVGVNCIYQ